MIHQSVLVKEVIEGLLLKNGDVVVDGTINGGGHSEVILSQGKEVTVVGFDLDSEALLRAEKRLKATGGKFFLIYDGYRHLDSKLAPLGIVSINSMLLDLGLSSNQFEESGRGFSFKTDEPLLMTFKPAPTEEDLTAREIVNTWEEENLADIIYGYGEERQSRKIAKAIVVARKEKPIETSKELADIISRTIPKAFWPKKIHPATQTFQALRITVNDELGSLREGLTKGFEKLVVGGRLLVISFHSIEDRVVKVFMREKAEAGEGILITKKPIVPSTEEVKSNPRSRSAKLRIIEKI